MNEGIKKVWWVLNDLMVPGSKVWGFALCATTPQAGFRVQGFLPQGSRSRSSNAVLLKRSAPINLALFFKSQPSVCRGGLSGEVLTRTEAHREKFKKNLRDVVDFLRYFTDPLS